MISLVISLAAIIAILIALPELPDPVATHWNIAGEVDGTGPVWFAFIAVGLMPLGCSAFVLFLARPLAGEGVTTMMRLMALTAPFIGWLVATGFGAGILLAVVSWFVLPKGEPSQGAEHPVTANGRTFVVTVPAAGEGAALLASLAGRG